MTTAAATGLDVDLRTSRGELTVAVSVSVAPGEVLAVLGPNGAGKTTLLRALAGVDGIDRGHIRLDGTTMADTTAGEFVPADRRPIGMMFQDHLLFPHLTARENVAFGLRCRGHARPAAAAEADRWLERVGLAGRAGARPRDLSGGESQRVALARALAVAPRLLILDEPTASLDAATTSRIRRDLRQHLAAFAGPTVLVTHDPLEAMALATRVLVLEQGQVTQTGPMHDVVARPATRYAADLLGLNLLRGTAEGTVVALDGSGATVRIADPCDGPVHLRIRPSAVSLHPGDPGGSPRNHWPAVVTGLDLLGERIRVELDGPVPLVAEITTTAAAELGLAPGARVVAAVKATEIDAYAA